MDKKSQLKKRLEGVNATRNKRLEMAEYLLGNPDLLGPLLNLCLDEKEVLGSRACWVLEFVHCARPELLYPFLADFASGIRGITREASARPLAKICEGLLKAHYGEASPSRRAPLTLPQKEAMAEACFDWLLGEGQVAPRIYSMQALAYLGKDFGWIPGELRAVLEQQYPEAPPAYKARARKVLGQLE